MAATEEITFCRICEALCGLVATVEDGRVVRLRPDPENPASRGGACPKGIAMAEIQNDPDRVLHPLRRRPGRGGFERIGWDEALDDIATRASAIRDEHGGDSIAWYAGVPYTFSFGHFTWTKGFIDALRSPHFYGSASQDVSTRLVASHLLYGTVLETPVPDLERTSLLLCLGANPFVSNGSVLTAPRIRDRLGAIVSRGGRVVVVDPRRSETARAFEHLPIRPDSDAWLLAAMLRTIFEEGLADRDALARQATGADALSDALEPFGTEAASERTGVPAAAIAALARDFARAPAAAAYGRTGACRGRFGTLVCFLLDALNAVSGNLDSPGGALFPASAIPIDRLARAVKLDKPATRTTPAGELPFVFGELPATTMATSIRAPGRGGIRALFVSAGNPVATVPNSRELAAALDELELLVSIDLYVNDTGRRADYVLPAATWLERDDTLMVHATTVAQPFVQFSRAAVAPYGEAREEWRIVEDLGRRMGIVPQTALPLRMAGRAGIRPTPLQLLEGYVRATREGDLFGLRPGGVSFKRLAAKHPHGRRLAEHHPTGSLRRRIRHRGRRVRLLPAAIARELERLRGDDPAGRAGERFPLRLVSLRELRSHNSWMHNAPMLMRRREFALRVHPDDAGARGLADGDHARLGSKTGMVEVPVRVTDEMTPGTVALPWGWGHDGGWRLANAAGGANLNELTGSAAADREELSGMSWLNGVPVRLDALHGHAPGPAA